MRKFIRLMLGAKSKYSNECYEGQFIGAGFLPNEDLTDHLYDNWREFNSKYRQVWLEGHPGKSKVAAGLACGMLWTVCKGLKKNDIVFYALMVMDHILLVKLNQTIIIIQVKSYLIEEL